MWNLVISMKLPAVAFTAPTGAFAVHIRREKTWRNTEVDEVSLCRTRLPTSDAEYFAPPSFRRAPVITLISSRPHNSCNRYSRIVTLAERVPRTRVALIYRLTRRIQRRVNPISAVREIGMTDRVL